MKLTSERYSRDYSKGELELALQFYNITRKFNPEYPLIDTVDLISERSLDNFLRAAKMSGFDVYGTRITRMFEQQIIDTKLHANTVPQVYTSYYGNANVLDLYNVVKVRIALYAPRYTKAHENCPSLAPSKGLLSDIKADLIGPPEYTVRYEEELSALDPQKVYDDLIKLGKGRDVAILCYERPPDFCHRHIAANWFKDELGIELIEFPYK